MLRGEEKGEHLRTEENHRERQRKRIQMKGGGSKGGSIDECAQCIASMQSSSCSIKKLKASIKFSNADGKCNEDWCSNTTVAVAQAVSDKPHHKRAQFHPGS